MNDVLICSVGTCAEPAQPEHSPCCMSTLHSKWLCCAHYCRSHFVEVNQCSPETHASNGLDAAARVIPPGNPDSHEWLGMDR